MCAGCLTYIIMFNFHQVGLKLFFPFSFFFLIIYLFRDMSGVSYGARTLLCSHTGFSPIVVCRLQSAWVL